MTSATITTTYTSGTATVSGNTYMGSRTYTFSGTTTYTPDGGSPEQIQVAGSGTTSSTCTKQ
jgi:hypothetical protein